MCPLCGRDAPLLYKGVVPYCTACGGLRIPLSAPSVNLAGKPAKVGGAFARATGALVLLVGLSMALGVWGVLYALWTLGIALAFAVPMALVALALGLALLSGGRKLRRAGSDAERETRERALLAAAVEKGGLTAGMAARIVGVGSAEADAILTSLAKREPERLTVDIDDQGAIWFRGVSALPARMRVEEVTAPGEREENRDENVDPAEAEEPAAESKPVSRARR